MFNNYLKIFFRTLFKRWGYSVSNIAGLAVGMVTCMLVLLFVRYEFGWNMYNTNYDNIYRVQQKVFFKERTEVYMRTGYALSSELTRQLSEIEKAIIVQGIGGEYLSPSDNVSLLEKKGFYANSDLFSMFTYNFLQGDPATALLEPYSIVLTKELADKYFPDQNAFGKMIKASKNKYLKITGIISNLPFNLDFRPDYLVSFPTLKEVAVQKDYDEIKNINVPSVETYLMLKPNTSVHTVNEKIYSFLDTYTPNNIKKLYLKPLSEIHLNYYETSDAIRALYYLGGTALFVLLMACINFINLATANSNLRKKEIGIRKVVGASRLSLFKQYIGESMLTSVLAMLLAFVLAELLLPFFNALVQRQLQINYRQDINFILLILAAFLATGVLSGIYPALFLSSFQPAEIMKGQLSLYGKKKIDGSKNFLRTTLVTFQLFISITLIVCTVYIIKQVDYMKNKDFGFVKNDLILCTVFGGKPESNFEPLRNELLRNSDIIDAAVSLNAPFNGYLEKEMNWEGAPEGEKVGIGYNEVGYDFINTYKMGMKLGRNFSREFISDSSACIINETAMRQIGWTDPLGKKIEHNRYTVIGVVKDFHPFSVHLKIRPYIMVLNPGFLKEGLKYSVRVKPGSSDETLTSIHQLFRSYFPGSLVEARKFTEEIDYGTKTLWEVAERIFFAFAVISVLIAANGLFGLVSFAAQRRIKEIGIRKVLGATIPGLYYMMTKELLFILTIATIISLPAIYIITSSFPGAYKYQLQAGDYLSALAMMFTTALAATLYHTTRAVVSNPVESLRSE